jgi:hypothetical protein
LSLTGEVNGQAGQSSAKGVTVVLFASDGGLRASGDRFVKVTTSDERGRYAFRGIVPGDYFVCALDGLEPGTANNETVLTGIAALAKRVDFKPGQTRAEILSLVRAPVQP